MSDTPDIIGRGFAFPFRVDKTGSIALTTGADDIESAMRVILCTAPGERVMRPEYGCDLFKLVFAPCDDTTAGLAIHYVRQAVERWEPRVEVVRLDAERDGEAGERLRIDLEYRVLATGVADALSVALNLSGEEAR